MQEIFEIFRFFSIKNLSPYLLLLWDIFKHWWWLPLPFILWQRFVFLWLWWKQELWTATQKQVLLEVKIPKEILKPIRAMEQVFAGIHSLHDVLVWKEKWIEGQFQLSISLEIVSIGGEVHFYIRTPASFRNVLEANVYSQYPNVEITEAEDYTRKVPQDIPNKNWDLFGFDMIATKEDPYPIRTYINFETEKEALEEKRIDPLAGLIEGMAALKPGEQLWVQVIAKPIREEVPWVKRGREIVDEITHRSEKETKRPPLLKDALDILVTGEPPKEEEEEEEIMPPEMKLTPGERELVRAIEEKITKFGFSCTVRFIYLGEKEVFFKPKARIPFGFFKEVSYENLGGLKPWKVTMTKSKTVFLWFWDKRREYLRKRKLFRHYIHRYPPLFPKPGGTFVLNTEEVATLYHFPGKAVAPAPAFSRIESKKGEAPPGLPTE
jgi:hypothetical protein